MCRSFYHDRLNGGTFKLHYGHIHNGNPSLADGCALALALADFFTEVSIAGSVEVIGNEILLWLSTVGNNDPRPLRLEMSKDVEVFVLEEGDGEFLGIVDFDERTLQIDWVCERKYIVRQV